MKPTGFRFELTAEEEVHIFHHNKLATTLRGKIAIEFTESAGAASQTELQMLMAKLTGNYRRGNERQAKNHPRNR